MEDYRLGAVEARFADLIWQHAPLHSRELTKLCEQELGWKKPTTYTVLRKLCEKGLFQNQNAIVSVLISREEYYACRGQQLLDEAFDGSLPAFLAAFTRRKALSAEDVAQIRQMIDEIGKET